MGTTLDQQNSLIRSDLNKKQTKQQEHETQLSVLSFREKDKQTKLEAHEALLSALKTNANTNIHEELQPMKDLGAAQARELLTLKSNTETALAHIATLDIKQQSNIQNLRKYLPPINDAYVLQSEFGPIKQEYVRLRRLRNGYS